MSAAVGCRLTLHVLDVAAGRPAAGMTVSLARIDGDEARVIDSTTTDADGRAGGVDPEWTGLAPGAHELRYDVGAYFGATSPPTATFYDEIPVRFLVGEADRHVHLALLVAPWSYTTYRGS